MIKIQKIIIVTIIILSIHSCISPEKKIENLEFELNKKISSFCAKHKQINVQLHLKQYSEDLFVADFEFKEPHSSYTPYQMLILEYLLTNVLDLENNSEKYISMYLDIEKGKAEKSIKYPPMYYSGMKKLYTTNRMKEITNLCFQYFDEIIPYDIGHRTEVAIFKRYPTEEGTKYNLIDILRDYNLESSLLSNHDMTLIQLIDELVKIYDNDNYDDSEEEKKGLSFLKKLRSIILKYDKK